MKLVKTTLVALMALSVCSFGQYETLSDATNTTATISIPAGQITRIFNFSTLTAGDCQLKLTKNSITSTVLLSYGAGSTAAVAVPELYFVGPAVLSFSGPSGPKFVLSYKLFPNSTIANPTPSTAVVIPADASGSVEIILESSVDLITWTAALPGSYGSSTVQRFFRVRAVASP